MHNSACGRPFGWACGPNAPNAIAAAYAANAIANMYAVAAAGIPPNKGGYFTDPKKAAETAVQYLNTIWKRCLDDFAQDARFDRSAFQTLLKGGITWLDTRVQSIAAATIDTYAHNGDTRTLGQLFSYGGEAVALTGTKYVVLGPDYFTNNTQTQQIATAVHEALHVALGFTDADLRDWLTDFGFVWQKPWNSGQITDWIVGTANQMDTAGDLAGCPDQRKP